MPKQKTSSSKKTSATKTTNSKTKKAKTKPKKITYVVYISSVWGLFKKSFDTIKFQKKFLGLSVLVYSLLSAALVVNVNAFDNVSSVKSTYIHGLLTVGKNLSASLSTLGSLSGTVGGSNNGAGSVIEFLFFLFFSLMFIKAIREANKSRVLKFSEGIYSSMYPFVQFLLVVIIIAIETLPILLASFFFNTIFSNGIAASGVERVIWAIVCAAILLLGIYLLVSSIFSLFIVTLPNMRPWAAIKASWKLVKSRRLLIARKIIAMFVCLFIGLGILALILVWLLPVISAWVLLVLGLMSFVLIYTYMYSLYRELL
jgi:hypothetical protein